MNNNYTVVIVEQITPPPNPERGVTRIVSPGTTINNKQENQYLMSIYIEKNSYMNKDIYISGVSAIDLSYDSSDAIEEYTVEFQVQYWEPGAYTKDSA